ncbi:GNAT family N-acetyltransferase [Shewanella sp. OPT22]|nr:GNAT family N-acetyltransferase [Shewanella sp. OPT22]
MKIRPATINDLATLAQLEKTHLNAELLSDSEKMLGQGFSLNDLKSFLNYGWIVVAEVDSNIVGYVIAADWKAFTHWPIYKSILKHVSLEHPQFSDKNSCQYGPIWIHQNHRGHSIFEQLVAEIKRLSSSQYQHMITFIAEENQHSYFAHTKKGKMQVLDFFEFEDRGYYLLSLK